MKLLASILASTEFALGRFAALLLVALLMLINVEVVARYIFGRSTLVADEYGGYLMVWMTMLGAIHLLRADRHLTMTWMVDKMSPRMQNVVGICAAVIGLAISAVLLYATWLLVASSARFATTSIQPSATPLVWPQLILPLGYALLCTAYVEEILRRLLGLPPRRGDEDISAGLG
ncbi:MAG: TRAP transporter small permease [Betaproteobacteria bacterium]|nr:TRAP transporter small permease [Betaproteobacteria bacterium]